MSLGSRPNPLAVLGISRELIVLLGGKKSSLKRMVSAHYRELVRTHHPDAGGEEDRFRAIESAFADLKDDETLVAAAKQLLAREAAVAPAASSGMGEVEWAVRLVEYAINAPNPSANGRVLVNYQWLLDRPMVQHDAADQRIVQRTSHDDLNADVVIRNGTMTISQVRRVDVGRGGPRTLEESQPVFYKGRWYEATQATEDWGLHRYAYEPTGKQRTATFLGTCQADALSELFSNTSEAEKALPSGGYAEYQTASPFGSGYHPEYVMPLMRSLDFDPFLNYSTLVGCDTVDDPSIVIVGVIAAEA